MSTTQALTLAGGGSIMPALTVQQASERYNVLVEFTKTVMVKDQDYGTIPGVQKPCLYKAGAEKLSSLFGLAPAFELIEKREDWTGRETNGEPLFYYFYKCKLYRGGELVGEADGSCNSWEKKYRYRDGKRKCPKCGGEFIITGKAEYGGGFLCFAKKGGCGAKFKDGDESITKQSIQAVPNPDIPEVINTVQKMAQKRSLVAAVLIACNASAFYTQDVEDMRTIDVDYEPFEGSRDNQREYLAEKGLDPYVAPKHQNHQPPPTKPEVIRELSDTLDQPPAIKTIEMRHAATVAEADAQIKDAGKPAKRKRGAISFEALKKWGELKNELRELTGADTLYYSALKAKGYDHSDEIKTEADATAIWKVLGAERNRLKQNAELTQLLAVSSDIIGARPFADLMGVHGCETITDVLALAGDPLAALLAEMKTMVDERQGAK